MLTKEEAERIYTLLVQEAGALESERVDFVCHRSATEWRFRGKLGFGGKFYNTASGMRVSCYPEDMTEERETIIKWVNALLQRG